MSSESTLRVAARPARPLLLFDGDCGFCRGVVARWRDWLTDRIDTEPLQAAGPRFPEIPPDQLEQSIHLIMPDGIVRRGAAAAFAAMAFCGESPALWWLYRHVPAFAKIADAGYCFVARNRGFVSKLVHLFAGRDISHPTFRIASDLFVRLLGLTYLFAFVSLLVQVDGLAGPRGILPAQSWFDAAKAQGYGFAQAPSLCWWLGADAGTLHALCIGGAICGALLVLGFVPTLAAAAAWLLYLSLCPAFGVFLNFQWDALLLEAGFLGIFLPPLAWRLRPGSPVGGSKLARFLLVWLLFRLMLGSGVVKLASQDATWWNLSALTYHYWTQPLPPWTAWYFDKMPLWAHKASCWIMFAIELVVPFLVFAPRRLRHFAGVCFLLLMGVILASGNYGFFDLLTAFLCVLLFDDHAWRKLFRFVRLEPQRTSVVTLWFRRAAVPVLLLVFALTWIPFASVFEATQRLAGIGRPLPAPRPEWLQQVYGTVAPYRSINHYGLFASMTTTRDEISLEGSDDGVTWKEYSFRWKPGDLSRRPPFCVPHMPRLDWQMWFASLGEIRGNPWLVNTMVRLLEGEPAVLDLLATNPFPDKPPTLIRATATPYRFTTATERAETGHWWKPAGEPRPYCPPVRLR